MSHQHCKTDSLSSTHTHTQINPTLNKPVHPVIFPQSCLNACVFIYMCACVTVSVHVFICYHLF